MIVGHNYWKGNFPHQILLSCDTPKNAGCYNVMLVILMYMYPDRAPLKEVLGGQYNYREEGRQVLRQDAKGRRRSRSCRCSKDPCAQKVSGERTDPSPKYRWKVHG